MSEIQKAQIAIYVMVGGGWLGKLYAEQPFHAYIDTRSGKLPYSRKEIAKAKLALIELAKAHDLDPGNLPEMPRFHNLGVF